MSDTGDAARDPAAGLARELGAARAEREQQALARLAELLGVVYRLRDPDGCPWDLGQSLDSMALNLLEEACESHEAVANGSDADVREELGDVLMNVLLMARIAEQEGRFDLGEVAEGIAIKLVRRHPHVFGDAQAADAQAAVASWNRAKAAEGKSAARPSRLDGVPADLPALGAALRTLEKAAATGFTWPDAHAALAKLDEELAELRGAQAGGQRAEIEHELGDLLFAAASVAHKHGLDPELALRRALSRFRTRFGLLERMLGERLGSASLDELLESWEAARAAGAAPAGADDEPPTLP